MKFRNILTIGFIIALLTGCIPSLNPIYTDKDLIFNAELVGNWMDAKSKEKWTFDKINQNEYKLTHTKGKNQATFKAHLVKIGETIFIDLYPENLQSSDYLYKMNMLPVHTFSKVRITNNKLIFEMFDPSWFEKGIASNQIDIDHVVSAEGNILLTASTADLQKFIIKNLNNSEAFQDSIVLKRI